MKKQLIFVSLLALSGMLNAQANATWYGNGTTGSAAREGNIGINTQVAPVNALDVFPTSGSSFDGVKINSTTSGHCGLFLKNWSTGGKEWQFWSLGYGHSWGAGNLCIYNTATSVPQILIDNSTGNVGIGKSGPAAKLDISSTTENALKITDANQSNTTSFLVKANGRTQLGSPLAATSPHYGGTTMLTVKGKIVAQEIVVTQLLWADYVFAKNYKLNGLEYLEKYIKENKHLPNVPSAEEVETNGLNITEMSKIQMEKIEELTLYIIEQNKKIEQLKMQIEEVSKSIKK